jgi:predicted transcriptional regulator
LIPPVGDRLEGSFYHLSPLDHISLAYYGMTMSRPERASAILTIRVDANLTRSLAREARRRRKTKSEVAREILAAGLGVGGEELDLAQEARRQSLLVSRRRSERDTLQFIEETADTRGWK